MKSSERSIVYGTQEHESTAGRSAVAGQPAKNVGVPPEQLRSELESGKYDKVLKNMSQKDSAMLQKVMQNPKMMEKLISSPQAKALYQKLSGK